MKKLLFIFILIGLGAFSQPYWGKYEHVAYLKYADNDILGNEAYWSITAGNSTKVFIITPCSGELKVDTNVYKTFVRSKTYYLSCRATDQGGLYGVEKLKVVLTKSNGIRQIPKATKVL